MASSKRKKQQNLPSIPSPEPKNYKKNILSALIIFAGVGVATASVHYYKVHQGIKRYETAMQKRIYKACGCVDEEGSYATITDWKDDDPELKGFPKDPETGHFLPIRDKKGNIIKDLPGGYPGIKDMHIPFIRGFAWSDGYGVSRCIPCAKAETHQEMNICNSRHLYTNITISDGDTTEKIEIENINEANPSLLVEIPNQQSDEQILEQQQQVWSDEMQKAGAIKQQNKQERGSY